MSEARKKPDVVLWTTLALIALPLLYVTSFGPMCWASSRAEHQTRFLTVVYRPLLRLMSHARLREISDDKEFYGSSISGRPLDDGLLAWYAQVGATKNACWYYVVHSHHYRGQPVAIDEEEWKWP